jgi:hypothetical protein
MKQSVTRVLSFLVIIIVFCGIGWSQGSTAQIAGH